MNCYVHMPMPSAFVDHFFPPTFFPPFGFLGLPFGHPPPKTFLALLAFEKCSGPCNASVLAPPFFPLALAAWLRGEGFLGFVAICSELYHNTTYVCWWRYFLTLQVYSYPPSEPSHRTVPECESNHSPRVFPSCL